MAAKKRKIRKIRRRSEKSLPKLVKAGTRNSFLRFLRPPPVPPVRGHFLGFNRTVSYWVHLVPPHPCPLRLGEGILVAPLDEIWASGLQSSGNLDLHLIGVNSRLFAVKSFCSQPEPA